LGTGKKSQEEGGLEKIKTTCPKEGKREEKRGTKNRRQQINATRKVRLSPDGQGGRKHQVKKRRTAKKKRLGEALDVKKVKKQGKRYSQGWETGGKPLKEQGQTCSLNRADPIDAINTCWCGAVKEHPWEILVSFKFSY